MVANYQELIVRWLTGWNAGEYNGLYISSRGKGTSLFMSNLSFGKNSKPQDVRIAVLQNKKVRLLTVFDGLGIIPIAKRLGIDIIENSDEDFRSDGTIKKGIVETR